MYIQLLNLDENHWSTSWVPISYKVYLENSCTFLWEENCQVMGICRAYYLSKNRLEIGDVWMNPIVRGKFDDFGEKFSQKFLRIVIDKIKEKYSEFEKISLFVFKDNIPALKLYKKLNFKEENTLESNKRIYMIKELCKIEK